MAYKHARLVIYYKSGNTKSEDRNNPNFWKDAPKYEYLCIKCGEKYPDFPEVPMTICLKCGKEGKDVQLVRQTIISALGVQFDPVPLEEEGGPVMSRDDRPLRIKFKAFVFKGSSVYNYGWFQDKIAEKQFIGGTAQRTYGIRMGRIMDPEGRCECQVAYLAEGTPTTYSYPTNIHSLRIDENALKLHSIKLSECGKRIVTYNEESIKQRLNLNLGERHERTLEELTIEERITQKE